jgi:predicted O-methyltransferase YrrM
MLRFAAVVGMLSVAVAAQSKSDQEIRTFLPGILQPGANIDARDGAYLHDLVVRLKAKRVLEVGTANGYSGIWMAMGLRKTGGRLVSIEIHEARHAAAREHFTALGLAEIVELRLADAVDEVKRLEGPFDLVFLDAGKSDYLHYYETLLPKLRAGGVIAAHNVKTRSSDLAPFLDKIRSDSRVRTQIYDGSRQGISVSFKR